METKNSYRILLSKVAIKDKDKLANSGLLKNADKLLDMMSSDPFCFPPSYEKLLGDLNGYYSRRINRQHRIVYKVIEDKREIHVIRMWTHYDNIK